MVNRSPNCGNLVGADLVKNMRWDYTKIYVPFMLVHTEPSVQFRKDHTEPSCIFRKDGILVLESARQDFFYKFFTVKIK